jgi:hypothetical protein
MNYIETSAKENINVKLAIDSIISDTYNLLFKENLKDNEGREQSINLRQPNK